MHTVLRVNDLVGSFQSLTDLRGDELLAYHNTEDLAAHTTSRYPPIREIRLLVLGVSIACVAIESCGVMMSNFKGIVSEPESLQEDLTATTHPRKGLTNLWILFMISFMTSFFGGLALEFIS